MDRHVWSTLDVENGRQANLVEADTCNGIKFRDCALSGSLLQMVTLVA